MMNRFFEIFSEHYWSKWTVEYFACFLFILALCVVFMACFVGFLRIHKKIETAYSRKIFHVVIFTMATLLQWRYGIGVVLIFGFLVSFVVLFAIYKGDGFGFYEALARDSDRPHRRLYIILPLITTALGGLVSNLLFGPLAFVGYLVCGWGDAVGEPVGAAWGKNVYRVPSLTGLYSTRSLQGSLAVFIVSSIAAYTALYLSGLDMFHLVWVSLLCGMAAALVEAVSAHGLDNFTIQVAATAVAYFFIH